MWCGKDSTESRDQPVATSATPVIMSAAPTSRAALAQRECPERYGEEDAGLAHGRDGRGGSPGQCGEREPVRGEGEQALRVSGASVHWMPRR